MAGATMAVDSVGDGDGDGDGDGGGKAATVRLGGLSSAVDLLAPVRAIAPRKSLTT